MRRRHLLALVIVALVVATVVAVGPVRVWDALTLRTVEEYWPNGAVHRRYRTPFWGASPPVAMERWLDALISDLDYDEWYENGQKGAEVRCAPVKRSRGWSETGQLRLRWVAGTGIFTSPLTGEIELQLRFQDDVVVETRTSPPWFTEEQILQAVEGVEE